MKNKTKLVLMATGLSCAVLGCLGSATYAWFTVKNNVGVNHTNLTVSTTNPNLSVALTRLNPYAGGETNLANIQEISTSFAFTDLSSQFGETFYKKNTSGTGYQLISADALQGKVVQFGLKVTNLPMFNAMSLYFDTAITYGNNTASASLRNWVRTGIYECTDGTYATRVDNGFAKAFMYDKANENAAKYINGTGEQNVANYVGDAIQNYATAVCAVPLVEEASTHYFKISIWMEGTAGANQDDAGGGTVGISTSFSLIQ